MAARKKAKAPRRKTAGRKKARKVIRKKAPARKKTPARKKRARKSTRGAARKKTTARRSGARKAARKKTPARRKAAARKKTAAKKTARRRATPKKATPKKAAAKKAAPKTPALEPLARRIIRAATETGGLRELYAPDATSTEPGQEPIVGYEGLEAKLAGWESIQKKAVWTPKHTFLTDDAIAIEWAAEVTMNDGRVVNMNEMAVHEIKNGKIVAERYYYDPSVLGAGAAQEPAAPATEPVVSLPPGREFSESAASPPLASTTRSIAESEVGSPAESADDDEEKVDPFDL